MLSFFLLRAYEPRILGSLEIAHFLASSERVDDVVHVVHAGSRGELE